jgi:hypothetical protein
MVIHLESGTCCTNEDQLDFYAQKCYQSKRYVAAGYHDWLRTQQRSAQRSSGFLTDDDLWVCEYCRQNFRTQRGMNQHIASPIHDPLVYACPGCDFRTTTLSGLVQHVESSSCEERIDGGTRSIGKMLHFLRVVFR